MAHVYFQTTNKNGQGEESILEGSLNPKTRDPKTGLYLYFVSLYLQKTSFPSCRNHFLIWNGRVEALAYEREEVNQSKGPSRNDILLYITFLLPDAGTNCEITYHISQ